MPAIWSFDAPAPGQALSPAAVSALLDCASAPPSAARLLRAIDTVVPVEYLSLVNFRRDTPELIEGSSRHPHEGHGRDVVAECFAIYRRSYWRADAVMRLADRVSQRPAREVAVLHCRADELPVAGWRNEIYKRERLTERFTLLHAPARGAVQAIHLYRDERQGLFRPDEIQRLLGLAPLLRQAHQAALNADGVAADREAQVALSRQRLARLVPALSPREAEVVARIAHGLSADGIAAELDVAPSTVVTLRKRAYAKLAEAGLPADRLRLARWLG
ncbi:MAG: LuxR family transcriptional regulator [Comamonadaceae bacterium]|jgi:DNA-binding CsgD family transcriptional regulator|uniref:helix-turn-helix transcriptional regulator n=1 Tax=Hydrogenophaga sp. SNF1 TaxID=3098762 RepID=UPI002ACBE51E|nr:LuxR C-terminal-related transcriptional regulator [Hydrogenophaga sp. SNF1]NCT99464.1 LuxR family transcriptional regulator [Comamonadaceae bacterium]WQB84019.1 LuxR C-terminal-related transcriptional regulator [Hydrogenophaga sp. SNF1]